MGYPVWDVPCATAFSVQTTHFITFKTASRTLLSDRMVIDTQIPIEKRAWLEGFYYQLGGQVRQLVTLFLMFYVTLQRLLSVGKGSRGKPQGENLSRP